MSAFTATGVVGDGTNPHATERGVVEFPSIECKAVNKLLRGVCNSAPLYVRQNPSGYAFAYAEKTNEDTMFPKHTRQRWMK